MAIEFSVNGFFHMIIYNYYTEIEVEQDIEQNVLDNLQQGKHVISIDKKLIFDIDDLESPLYKFDLDIANEVSYEFNKI